VRFQGNNYVWGPYSIATALVEVEEEVLQNVPKIFTLHQNNPNLFRSTTTIRYGIPRKSYVKLRIYNIAQ
jgi:hypothetical protein